MRASDFEFRHRASLVAAIFGCGFACSFFDHVMAASALAERLGVPVRAVLLAAAALVVAAAALRTWASAYLAAEVVHDRNLRADQVVADGPYRHTRNPLYLGGTLLGLGMGLVASRVGLLVIALGLTALHLRLAGREQLELERANGDRYRRFRDAVPAFFPSLRPAVPASGAQPRWAQAFVGELFMWGFACGLLALALTTARVALYAGVAAALFALTVARPALLPRLRR